MMQKQPDIFFLKMLRDAAEKGIEYHDQLNDHMGQGNAYQRSRPYHCTLLAQTDVGLKNLFKLISISPSPVLLSSSTNSTFTN